jgi:hypothetical protein
MGALHYLSSRQISNYAALPHIGSPAFDTLDDILSRIDAILASVAGVPGYISQEIALPIGVTSYAVSVPTQTDTSYVVYALMENLVDATPQFQEPIITGKTSTGFTVEFNAPLNSPNYILSYIIPLKAFQEGESAVSLGNTSSVVSSVLQSGSNYGIISALENYTDTNLEFQTSVITAKSGSAFTASYNAPALTGNYVNSYMINATSYVSLVPGATSAVVSLPINYGTSGYGVVAVMQNLVDGFPMYQPLLVTGKTDTSFTISWNVPFDTANYTIFYYVITLAM